MAKVVAGGRKGSLAFRFVLILGLGVALIFAGTAYWNLTLQRRHMTEMIQNAGIRYATLIRNATHDGMLENDRERVGRVIASLGRSDSVQRIRVIDRYGKVQQATDPSLFGPVPISSFQCQVCHERRELPSSLPDEHRVRVVSRPGGESYLNVVEPIPNEPGCSTADCHAHPHDRRVLGIIDIEMPLGAMEAHVRDSQRQLGVGLLVTVLAIGLLTAILTWRLVIRPIRRLGRAADRVAGGDLTATVPVHSRDEIGRMAATWNTMVAKLNGAQKELADWSKTLEQRVDAKTREVEAAHQRMLVVEKMASLGKLAAVVAHEINNPLAGIATYARLMHRKLVTAGADRAGDDPAAATPIALKDVENAKILELMEAEASRCGKIVRNLLLFSRTPGARFAPEDLRPVLERCAMLVKHQADLQEVEIRVEVPPDAPKVECDASQVQQVVLALVMNAIEAMPSGGTLTITVAPDPLGDALLLQVGDTGVGIRAEELPLIFEPFHTTKEQGEGVGLGLSVVYGIVQRHHGRVDVRSKVGEGTTFTVRLPLRQPARDEAAGEAAATTSEEPGSR